MVQVWDRLNYYSMLDRRQTIRDTLAARLRAQLGLPDPYKLFDLSGRFLSGVEPRPDRPWTRSGRAAREDDDTEDFA